MKNPNAAVAAGGSTLSAFVVWLAGNVFHWSLSAEDGAIIAGIVSAIVLFIAARPGLGTAWTEEAIHSGGRTCSSTAPPPLTVRHTLSDVTVDNIAIHFNPGEESL